MIDDMNFCPEEALTPLLSLIERDDEAGLANLQEFIAQYPGDPRLHFLKGSVLAGLQRYDEGHGSMKKAVELAPDFALARFQLGFLEYTSGRAGDAALSWAPFDREDESHPFRLFATGLCALASDDVERCIECLEGGIRGNLEHPLVNTDMQLILDELHAKGVGAPVLDSGREEDGSAAQQLLWQHSLRSSTRH